jgi:hypothetical protein
MADTRPVVVCCPGNWAPGCHTAARYRCSCQGCARHPETASWNDRPPSWPHRLSHGLCPVCTRAVEHAEAIERPPPLPADVVVGVDPGRYEGTVIARGFPPGPLAAAPAPAIPPVPARGPYCPLDDDAHPIRWGGAHFEVDPDWPDTLPPVMGLPAVRVDWPPGAPPTLRVDAPPATLRVDAPPATPLGVDVWAPAEWPGLGPARSWAPDRHQAHARTHARREGAVGDVVGLAAYAALRAFSNDLYQLVMRAASTAALNHHMDSAASAAVERELVLMVGALLDYLKGGRADLARWREGP